MSMKLVYQPDPASPSLLLSPSSPIPTPTAPDDVLVRVKAASPCRHELLWELADPHLFPNGRTPPRVPCPDGAGVVVSCASGGAGGQAPFFQPGDEVYFFVDFVHAGCLAEYTLVKTGAVALRPRSVGWAAAAATPLSALTAWQGLFTHGGLVPPSPSSSSSSQDVKANAGKTVLVTGAAGSVGSWAVQLAVAAGVASITGVCSESKHAVARSFGATDTLSYPSFSASVSSSASAPARRYDVILDTAGGDVLRDCWAAVRPDTGILLAVGADQPDKVRPEDAPAVAKSEWFLVQQSRGDLEAVAALVDGGRCRATVDSEFAFGEYEAAFERVDRGQPRGKVVINVS